MYDAVKGCINNRGSYSDKYSGKGKGPQKPDLLDGYYQDKKERISKNAKSNKDTLNTENESKKKKLRH